jgi:hypothetical protein
MAVILLAVVGLGDLPPGFDGGIVWAGYDTSGIDRNYDRNYDKQGFDRNFDRSFDRRFETNGRNPP